MIRRAVVADGPPIAALFRRAFGTLTFLPTLHTPDEDREFFAGVVQEQQVWVWDRDDHVLGFIAVGPAMVNHLYVEPGEQGRGIGSALLAHAQAQRPHGVRLWTFQRNDRARAFYEHRGFRLVETTDGSGNEERTPDALYEWTPD
jgi:GNAT superfamily N-acetyltransferase